MATRDDYSDMRTSRHLAPNHSSDDFAQLLAAARRGENWAFEALFTELAVPLRNFVRARGAEDADGLANDVLAELFRGLPRFSGSHEALRGFAFHIARRRLVDDYRRRSRRPQTVVSITGNDDTPPELAARLSTGDRTSEVAVSRVSNDAAIAALDVLTPDQRDVLLLRLVSDLSIAEVAAALDKPVTAIKALQRRAVESLKRKTRDGEVSW